MGLLHVSRLEHWLNARNLEYCEPSHHRFPTAPHANVVAGSVNETAHDAASGRRRPTTAFGTFAECFAGGPAFRTAAVEDVKVTYNMKKRANLPPFVMVARKDDAKWEARKAKHVHESICKFKDYGGMFERKSVLKSELTVSIRRLMMSELAQQAKFETNKSKRLDRKLLHPLAVRRQGRHQQGRRRWQEDILTVAAGSPRSASPSKTQRSRTRTVSATQGFQADGSSSLSRRQPVGPVGFEPPRRPTPGRYFTQRRRQTEDVLASRRKREGEKPRPAAGCGCVFLARCRRQ
ncbi:hypothetical protein HPB52_024674 [Rhipicephalus sanguineus]|uniref:Uncharacterized protein n=1 Tax=Rhipicephalus sanguineus TaxID=34632 RepID=A0A9D4PAD2_RHISA|nr:hypothetical protein HPB52_024674 [Rhipicephalus sanguineus]